jgi:hypothetical protein
MRRGKTVCARLASAKPRISSSVGSQFVLKKQSVPPLQSDVVFHRNPQLRPAVPTEVCPEACQTNRTSLGLNDRLIVKANPHRDLSWAVVNTPDSHAPKPINPRTVQPR